MSRYACFVAAAVALIAAPAAAQIAQNPAPPADAAPPAAALPPPSPADVPLPPTGAAAAPTEAAAPIVAQTAPGPAPVVVTQLAAPDSFSTPGRATGLPPELWRGASLDTVQAVLPLLAERPLSPAAAALARRVLATGAPGPKGAGNDPAYLAGRANALRALGDPKAAATILGRAAGLENSPDLSRAAAESALLAGDDARACQVAGALTSGRDEIYWLRLRTYCQAAAGQTAQAQLTFDLAQAQARDPVFGRLMGAKLAGGASPGAASLRNGLDYALSRSLGLDLSTAKASPEVAAVLAGGDPTEPAWNIPTGGDDAAAAAGALAAGGAVPPALVDHLLDAAQHATGAARARAETTALLVVAYQGVGDPAVRGRVAGLGLPDGGGPVGRDLALDAAADQKLIGETALLALWTCAQSPRGELAAAQRIRIVRALRRVGLERDARNFAVEGLVAAP